MNDNVHIYKENEWVMVARDSGSTFNLVDDEVAALREFFQHERDTELGRWRDPKQPHFVVYPRRTLSDGTRQATVVNEKAGANVYVFEGAPRDMDVRIVAARYFAAHPEPKPWHDAKPGEVWVIDFEAGIREAVVVPSSGWNKGLCVVSARRIWPELAAEDKTR